MTARARVQIGASGKLPRPARLRRRGEFSRIQRYGSRIHTGAFTIIVHSIVDAERPRFGCAISRKVGNAVVRNRVRRLLKEIFRRCANALPPVDFVFIAKPEAAELAKHGLDALAAELLPAIERSIDAYEKKQRAKRPQTNGEKA
jgi:ribonuclease P protein component